MSAAGDVAAPPHAVRDRAEIISIKMSVLIVAFLTTGEIPVQSIPSWIFVRLDKYTKSPGKEIALSDRETSMIVSVSPEIGYRQFGFT